MACINILAHLHRWVQRNCCCFSLPSSACPWTRPSGRVPGRLMAGAPPLWPAEFYLRLTSRFCHRGSTHSASLINLSASLSSVCLLHLSLHSLLPGSLPPSFVLICLLWPISFSSAAAVSQLSQQASLFFVLARLLPFISLTNKVESNRPRSCTHADEATNVQSV